MMVDSKDQIKMHDHKISGSTMKTIHNEKPYQLITKCVICGNYLKLVKEYEDSYFIGDMGKKKC